MHVQLKFKNSISLGGDVDEEEDDDYECVDKH